MLINIQIIKKNDSSVKQSDPGNFLNSQFVIFRCQKYVKQGYIEMTKKIYLETFKKCAGSLCFTLLTIQGIIL